jgi:hypothetical protein
MRAAGGSEAVRQRTVETRDELTAQEAMIPGLLVTGTYSEIGGQLFSSSVQKGKASWWHRRRRGRHAGCDATELAG